MSLPDCTDICEIIIQELTRLGFKVSDDEDHTEMIEQLAQCKLVRLHPIGEEKTWHLWDLTESTIEAIAKQKGLSIAGKDPDEIARITKKGIDSALDFVWEEAIENAIKLTKADWAFNIISQNLSDSSEHRNGNRYELTETWAGEIGCKSGDASFVFDFELVHHATKDNDDDRAEITSGRPDVFNEDEWDDLTGAMTDFIKSTYRAEHWRE